MVNLYNNKFAKQGTTARKYYDKLLVSMVFCPYCQISQVATLDHYLPQTVYPIFSVTPVNLVPSCSDCNKSKTSKHSNQISCMPIHPYYDKIDNIQWLIATLQIFEKGIVATYQVDPSLNTSDPVLYARLKTHMDVCKLKEKFCKEAARRIAEKLPSWIRFLNKYGLDELIEDLKSDYDSIIKDEPNSWKQALYKAFLDNPSIFTQLLNT